jgi:hypothetical protein
MYMIITMIYIYHCSDCSRSSWVKECVFRVSGSSQAPSIALRCWKCPQLGPSCTPSPFDETRDQLVEKTGVLHLLRNPQF